VNIQIGLNKNGHLNQMQFLRCMI